MDLKRVWRTFRLATSRNRNAYLRKAHIFAHFGEKSSMQSRIIPLFPEAISIGNNVRLAAGVHLVTHDMVHRMLNNRGQGKFREHIGCIRIDDNVFVGAFTTILPDVHIGSDVVIGAGSLVTKDLPGGFVYAGVPARPIGTFADLLSKRQDTVNYPKNFKRKGHSLQADFADWLWNDFHRRHPVGGKKD